MENDVKPAKTAALQQPSGSEKLDDVWLKAAIVGGLWAAIEIIFGSFLHNLRMPFAGSVLTFISISLLISFHRMWPDKGLIWRAGLICALMKSISPSSVILGPMSGIFFEALLLEAGIRLFAGSRAGYFAGAILAMMSTLLHKVISLLILYGWDLVTIYTNLYYFFTQQLHIENADPWLLVWLAAAVYMILGMLACIIGLAVGNRTVITSAAHLHMLITSEDDFLKTAEGQQFSFYLLFLHLFSIPAGLMLISMTSPTAYLTFIIIYLSFCFVYYRKSMRRLKKPVFWFQLFTITLLAAIFWGGVNSEDGLLNKEGLVVGLEMNLRAIFIVAGFTSLSVELRNPAIRDFLFSKGLGKLYLALNLSFSAFPVMIKNMPRPRQFFRNPLNWLAQINSHAVNWLEVFYKR